MSKVVIVPNNRATFHAEHLPKLGFMKESYVATNPTAMGY